VAFYDPACQPANDVEANSWWYPVGSGRVQ
jgi:hypothetical protein